MTKIYYKNSNKNLKNSDNEKKDINNKKVGNKKRSIWAIKITIITFFLALLFSFVTEITSSNANVIVAMILLIFLILINIVFDGIGVAATSCDIVPLLSMSAKKVKAAYVAVKLVKNAEKVSNICADVIGDICGIISGAFSITIIIKLANDRPDMYLYNIIFSSIIAALTVGGKAFVKEIAMKNSKEIMLFTSRVINIFYKPRNK